MMKYGEVVNMRLSPEDIVGLLDLYEKFVPSDPRFDLSGTSLAMACKWGVAAALYILRREKIIEESTGFNYINRVKRYKLQPQRTKLKASVQTDQRIFAAAREDKNVVEPSKGLVEELMAEMAIKFASTPVEPPPHVDVTIQHPDDPPPAAQIESKGIPPEFKLRKGEMDTILRRMQDGGVETAGNLSAVELGRYWLTNGGPNHPFVNISDGQIDEAWAWLDEKLPGWHSILEREWGGA
jgi:hypothetical protein